MRARAAARAVFTIFLLVYGSFCIAEPSVGERMAAIRAFGLRAEGSSGEAAAFGYVETALREAGLAPVSSDFSDASEDYSRSRIVEALIPGAREDELAIVVPIGAWSDSPDPGEGAYGIALALDEAARLSSARNAGTLSPITVRFVFLGAEKRGGYMAGRLDALGSKTWLARQEGRARLAVLYLDMPYAPARITLRSAGKGVLSPYWYYEGSRRALGASGIAFGIEANRQQAYRLGLASDYGPAAPYLEAGIPAVELRGEGSVDVHGNIAADWLAAFVEHFSQNQAGGFLDSWDRHYFIIQVGRLVAVLREKTYVAILVGLVALILTSLLTATVARRTASRQLLKRTPTMGVEILALFGTLVLVLLAGKGLSLLETVVFGSKDSWRLFPRLFALAHILVSFLLFLSAVSYLVEKRVLTPNPYFYEFAALICLAIDVLIFSVVDLSASFYFIWALLLVEASLVARKRWVTLFAYFFMYVPLLIVVGELVIRPDIAAYGKILAPNFHDILALSALSLPVFAFTVSPLLFFAPPGTAARKKAVGFFAFSAIAVEALVVAFFLIALPPGGSSRQDLSVSELIDQDKGRFVMELSSLRRLGKNSILRGKDKLDYYSLGDRAKLEGADTEKRIGISETATPFLDRVDENIRIDFSSPPDSLEMSLESADEIMLYDCSLPYKVAVDGKSAIFFAGDNPGTALSFSIAVPSSFRARLVVRAHYLRPLAAYSQSAGSPLGYGGLRIEASRTIGGAARPMEGAG